MSQGDRADEPQARPPDFIVGIGASAGGLEALVELLGKLHVDSIAVVVVQHLSPTHESALPQILARATTQPVVTAADGILVEVNGVYVIPPNAALEIAGGRLRMTERDEYRGDGAIDVFFRSLAADQGARAVGVVLSGTGRDGTLGLQAIKEAGGITFVQQPDSARFEGMPRAAFDSGWADYCGSPAQIGDELMSIGHQPYLAKPARAPGIVQADGLGKLMDLLLEAFGHDLTQYKPATIERRTERRMALRKLQNIDEYLALLRSDGGELRQLHRDLMIGVTHFFRDHAPFELLKTKTLPDLLASKRAGSTLRVWVPGCSTGEEAYSIAIVAAELLDAEKHDVRIQIFATDIDDEAVQRARRGVYAANIALDVSPERLHRFFVRTGEHYQINRRIRDTVVFSTQDVTADAPFSRLDLLSCRNLLIYLKPTTQKKVLRVFHYALQPRGYLLLGSSETIGDAAEQFALVDGKNKLYVCRPLAMPGVLDVRSHRRSEPARTLPVAGSARPVVTLAALADRKILDLYGPAGVVVSPQLDVLYFRGRTSAYLDPSPGVASLNLLRLARPELQADLRRATTEALQSGAPVALASRLTDGDTRREFKLEVLPIVEPETRARCLLVLFHEPHAQQPLPPPTSAIDSAFDPRMQDLELELLLTKEHLQSTIDELESANEALKASNEELQSSNEELQSSNEELETSKEEIQATNEELTTVNDELQKRLAELQQTNDDLHNVLTGVDNTVVIVGPDWRIRRFTQAAARLVGLERGDVGRSIADLERFVGGVHLEQLAAGVVEALRPIEQEVQCADGRWYVLRVAPYRTLEHSISGVLLMLTDIDVRKRSLRRAEDVAGYASQFLDAVSQALAIIDVRLRVVWVNEPFYRLFGVVPEETVGSTLSSLGDAGWDTTMLEATLAEALQVNGSVSDVSVPRTTSDGEDTRLHVTVSRVRGLRDEAVLMLLTFEVR